MTPYQKAKYLRPIAILSIPAFIISTTLEDSFVFVGITLLLLYLIGHFTKCKACGYSIYLNINYPLKTLLAIPHKQCTRCGSNSN
jgi:hypothetical protein